MNTPRIILTLFSITLLFSFTNVDLPILNYIDQYNVIAVQEMERTGIPASITLAQGIIESRYGMSGLAKNSNNHFGIKCNNNWQGGKYYHKDDDYVNGKLVKSCFRTYTNPAASYYDHSEFLMVNQRYRFLFDLEKTDYKGWAKGLKKAGYATAKDYASTLINTIEKFELYKYDQKDFELLVFQKEETITAPKAERIPEYIDFTITQNKPATTRTHAETLVAEAPPKATPIPANYKPGDGLRATNKNKSRRSFQEIVYGASSQYLDELTPQVVGKK